MSQSGAETTQTSKLINYDKEPIHIPGSIQPHGILFVLEEPQLKILQLSSNTLDVIGFYPDELLNKNLKHLLDATQIDAIEKCLLADFENINPLKISIKNNNKFLNFDGIIHRADGLLVLELEPIQTKENPSFLGFYHLVKGPISKMQKASTLHSTCQILVKEVRKVIDFDRVIIYQFNSEEDGTVIAEDKLENLTSYLGLHYPASDIPDQARELFTRNWLRLIPDASYQPIALIPADNPVTNTPLDLSLSVLRSVSPCHIEYLKNMGVSASMSISLIKDKKLWGLIAFHNQSAKFVPYEVRTTCEFLGQVLSLDLMAKEDKENIDYQMTLKAIQSKFIESIPQAENFLDDLVKSESNLLDLVSAQGVAVYWDSHFILLGKTPQETDIQDLIEWVTNKFENNVFYTESLTKIYPTAKKFTDVASGLLALSISKAQRDYILWFRPEVIQTVNWGGNPNEPIEVEQNGILRLSPRNSFELWQETVRLKSLPWKQCEIDATLELRSAIIGIVLRKADELAKINVELERSNRELDSFAYIASHDLKEPLRGIHNYSSFLIEDYADVLSSEGVSKLQTMVHLTQRMEELINSLLHFSRLGRMELCLQKTDLSELVKHVIDILSINLKETIVDIRIPRPLPYVRCDRVQVREVFSNLISNAIKYNDKANKLVEIGFLDSAYSSENQNYHDEENPEPAIVFYIRDNGIGIREKHLEAIFRIFKRLHASGKYGGGTGAGLTIAKKIVERHGGRIWVESTNGEGSTFYFTLH